jgi:Anp1
MSPNEAARWEAHHTTPVTFNHHEPIVVQSPSVQPVDLNPIVSTRQGASNKERVLIATPLRNAAYHIPKHFDLLLQLSYPHSLIDLAFIVSDCDDDTFAVLSAELDRVQKSADDVAFRSATIIKKDFGVTLSQDVKDRHGWEAQGPRRKMLGRARNYLLASALKNDHAWVYWRDVDINDCPTRIIEDLIEHDRDVIVPNIWFHRYEKGKDGQPHDIEGRCKSWCILSTEIANFISRLQCMD